MAEAQSHAVTGETTPLAGQAILESVVVEATSTGLSRDALTSQRILLFAPAARDWRPSVL